MSHISPLYENGGHVCRSCKKDMSDRSTRAVFCGTCSNKLTSLVNKRQAILAKIGAGHEENRKELVAVERPILSMRNYSA